VNDDDTPNNDDDNTSVATKMLTKLPPIMYAFGCQIQIYSIFYSVEDSRVSISSRGGVGGLMSFMPVIVAAPTCMALCFSCVGSFGVMAFPGEDIDGDVLKNLSNKGDLGQVARCLLIIAVLLAAPLIVFPARNCLQAAVTPFLKPVSDPNERTESSAEAERMNSKLTRIATTVVVCTISGSLAISQVDFLSLLSILGAFVASPLMIVLPGVALIKLLLIGDDDEEEDDREKGLLTIPKEYFGKHELGPRFKVFAAFIGMWCIVVGLIVFGTNLATDVFA